MTEYHPTFQQLVSYVDHTLAPQQRAEIAQHLPRCPRCASDVAWLDRLASKGIELEPIAAPPQARERLRQLFRARRSTPRQSRLAASLRFDSARTRPAGTRSGPATERQLLFEASPFTLDIRFAPEQHGWVIAGQVLGPPTSGLAVMDGAESSAMAELSGVSEFTIARLAPGRYTLRLHLDVVDIVIPDLDLDG
jgi:anti-sigma factor RsiW